MSDLLTIALVEDEEEIRQGLITFVPWESLGYRVVGDYANGREALAALIGSSVEVVFSDIRMPGMDGLELARELRASGFKGAVVLHTGYKDFEYARQAIEYGVRQYFIKSSRLSTLVASLKKLRDDLGPRSSGDASPQASRESLVDSVKAFVQNGSGMNLTLKAVADKVGRNEDYLGRVFLEISGVHYSDYVLEWRMQDAWNRLKNGQPVAEVATKVGYTSSQNFARAFLRRWSMTPSQVRNHQADTPPYLTPGPDGGAGS